VQRRIADAMAGMLKAGGRAIAGTDGTVGGTGGGGANGGAIGGAIDPNRHPNRRDAEGYHAVADQDSPSRYEG